MTKKAFIFPGQGSQKEGMGNIFAGHELFKKANNLLEFDLEDMCINGSQETLTLTQNAQPALFTVSYIQYIESKEIPDAVAGHSLGEYTALCAAGVLSFEDTVKLVRKRGELMSKAIEPGKGGMAAILGLTEDEISNVTDTIEYKVEIANYNCPGQIVISGEKTGIDIACEKFTEMGKKAIPLSVSGPFHSSLMKPAAEKFSKLLDKISFKDPELPIIMNVTSLPLTSGKEAKELMVKQLYSSVMWTQSIVNMTKDGIEEFVEIGPGKVLSGLVKKIKRSL